jgi:hypothetical protein
MKVKRTDEQFYFSNPFLFIFSYFFFLSFFFFPSFIFSYHLFIYYFLFIISMLLQTVKKHSTCYSSPPPCLNDCSSSSIEVRGLWQLEKYQILVFLYNSFEIFKGILMSKLAWSCCIDESLHMLYVLKSCYKISRKSIERSSILNLSCGQGDNHKKMFWDYGGCPT